MQHHKQTNPSSSRVPEQFMSHQKKQSKKSGFKHFYTPQGHYQQQQPKLAATATSLLAVQTNLSSNQGLLPPSSSSSLSPLRCKYCNKLFAKFTTLRKHEMLHTLNGNNHNNNNNNLKVNPDVDLVEIKSEELDYQHHNKLSSSALTLTPSLLSNLNKLANLKSSEGTDGKKPAILININTNTPSDAMDEAKKSQEMPLNSNSGLMISSVSSVNKSYFETIEKQRAASNATVFVQNGKKVVSLADLQCPICKKIVSQPFSLKVHLRTHTLEK